MSCNWRESFLECCIVTLSNYYKSSKCWDNSLTFICSTRSSTGLLEISGGENFSKSSLKTADEYNLSHTKNVIYNCLASRPKRFLRCSGNKILLFFLRGPGWDQDAPVTVPGSGSAGSTAPLIGGSLWRPRYSECSHTRHFVIKLRLDLPSIDHVLHVRYGQRCLCYIGGHNTKTTSFWWWLKDLMMEDESLYNWLHLGMLTKRFVHLRISTVRTVKTTQSSLEHVWVTFSKVHSI